MLVEKLNSLTSQNIHVIYNKYWQDCGACDEDIKKHIVAYIIQFYRFRHLNENCKDKCRGLIEDIKNHKEEKNK